MIVLVLIGIMAAMIIPEMHGTYENALLRSSSRQWLDAIGLAYSRAVTMNQTHRVRLDRRLGKFFVERHVSAGGDRDGFIPVEDGSSREKLDQRIDVKIRMPMQEMTEGEQQGAPTNPEVSSAVEQEEVIGFYADGTADAREIVLQDRDGFRLALRINPTTARVQVVELGRQ